jgi:23S rRNA U2552 (ribose-2'-O)-methylase RlmE/FtsJ
MLNRLKGAVVHLFRLVGWVPQLHPPYLTRDWRWRYRPDRGSATVLGPELAAPTTWSATRDPVPPGGELAEIFLSTPDIQKWMHYLPIYERTLADLRHKPLKFLEIGVDRGGSLQAWRRHLGAEATIVGIDINPACAHYDDPAGDIHVRIGSQDDTGFLRKVVDEFGAFDVIVDDGSHFTSHLIDSFRFLFPHGLAAGGVYLAEDLQTNYWRHYRNSATSFLDLAKGLVDVAHRHYQEDGMLEPDFRIGSPERRMQVTVPLATRLVESIEFHDGMVVIHKAATSRELPGSFRA